MIMCVLLCCPVSIHMSQPLSTGILFLVLHLVLYNIAQKKYLCGTTTCGSPVSSRPWPIFLLWLRYKYFVMKFKEFFCHAPP